MGAKRKAAMLLGTAVAAVAAAQGSAQADVFSTGNLVVYRVGDGASALSSASTSVYLDQYSVTGSLVNSVNLSSGSTPLTASGSATSEGLLTLSGDGHSLIVPGYASAAGTASVVNSTTIPRAVAVVDTNGGSQVQSLGTFGSGNNVRSAASPDGVTIYAATAGAGVGQITLGATGNATNYGGTTVTNTRGLGLFNGQLYMTTGSGSSRGVYAVNSTSTSYITGSGTSSSSPYGFAIVNASPDGTSPYTLYVTDNSANSLTKYALDSSGAIVGSALGTITGLSGVTGLTVSTDGTNNSVYVTTPSKLISILDAIGNTGTAFSGETPTTLATAASNEAFRGVAFAPTASTAAPEPTSLALGALAVTPLLGRRRRRA